MSAEGEIQRLPLGPTAAVPFNGLPAGAGDAQTRHLWEEVKTLTQERNAAYAHVNALTLFSSHIEALFFEYRGYLDEENKRDEFEEKLATLICGIMGHSMGPDQCGRPEHDICYRCNHLARELGLIRHPDFCKDTNRKWVAK